MSGTITRSPQLVEQLVVDKMSATYNSLQLCKPEYGLELAEYENHGIRWLLKGSGIAVTSSDSPLDVLVYSKTDGHSIGNERVSRVEGSFVRANVKEGSLWLRGHMLTKNFRPTVFFEVPVVGPSAKGATLEIIDVADLNRRQSIYR